jgi:hypothetical protein
MPQSPTNPPTPPDESTLVQTDDLGPADQVQWFGRPDAGEKPLGFWRLVVITLSGHIGVRPRAKRHEDFRRANGLHVFIAAVVYFFLVIGALIVLVNVISSH